MNLNKYNDASISKLLDRTMPASYSNTFYEDYSVDSLGSEDETGKSVFVFRLGTQWLAVATSYVKEVVDQTFVHRIPHINNPIILGLCNVHGELYLVINFKQLIGVRNETINDATKYTLNYSIYPRAIVLEKTKARLAFFADEILGIHIVSSSMLQPVPLIAGNPIIAEGKAVFVFNKQNICLLDSDKILERLGQHNL